MLIQEFYNDICNSLRTHGNKYGTVHQRGWGWCNPNDPSQRCALAQFTAGTTGAEIECNLRTRLQLEECDYFSAPAMLANTVVRAFDTTPMRLNDPEKLEYFLKQLADEYKLRYYAPGELKLSKDPVNPETELQSTH